jgi:hypothetical protein
MKQAAVLIFLALAVAACGGNQRIMESSQSPTPSANTSPPLSSFELELKAMRTADFNFIYVFRRKDGAPLDAGDKKLASDNIPPEINRRKVIEDGRAVIIGSNYRLPPENAKALAERFVVEDYSKPENEMINANANTNTSR